VHSLRALYFSTTSSAHHCQFDDPSVAGNFLISHRGEVKVADLGILKQLAEPTGPQIASKLPKTSTFVGTTTYMSPERIDGKEYSFPADVWAFGLSMITIAQGAFPMDTQGGYWTILHGIRDAPPPTLPAEFSDECRDFVAQCMKRNPEDRKTVKDLLKHPFLRRTVVEDLTYDQSYERGRTELLSIIDAVHAHVDALKADMQSGARPEDFAGDKAAPYHRIFGDIEHASAQDTLRLLLLGETPAGPGQQSGAVEENKRRPIRPPLTNLAKQLHLPIDKVEMETRKYLDGASR
jgi:serine/threonine protein kinase